MVPQHQARRAAWLQAAVPQIAFIAPATSAPDRPCRDRSAGRHQIARWRSKLRRPRPAS